MAAGAGLIGPVIGSRLYVGTTATNPVGDSYTEIGQVEQVPPFGPKYAEVKFTAIADGIVQKFPGELDYGSVDLTLGRSTADAGQDAVIAILGSNLANNFKITLHDQSSVTGGTPTTYYFKARVLSYTTNLGTVNNVVKASVLLSITGTFSEVIAT
jgi:hypothetical protein